MGQFIASQRLHPRSGRYNDRR